MNRKNNGSNRVIKNNKNFNSKSSFKNKVETIKGKCVYLDSDGKGIIKNNNKFIPITYLLKGEKAVVQVTTNGDYRNTVIKELLNKSESRVTPKCEYFYDCGGCQLQHMSNSSQNDFKESMVRNLMKHLCSVDKIISMETPYNYRNKVISTFDVNENKEVVSGFYKEHSHDVIHIERCIVQSEKADAILVTIRMLIKKFKFQIFNEDTQNGFLRHVLIRSGFQSGQIMIVFVVADKIFPSSKKLIKALRDKHPEISTVVMNVNNRKTSVVLGDYEKILFGSGVIEDKLCNMRFQFSSKSFYQINPIQTEKLYDKAIEFADLSGNEVVLDAYSGIGTISLLASKSAKSVIGVEINGDAVKNAIVNAKINNIKNVRFYKADASEFIVELANQKKIIDTVFMDPPRSGSDGKFLSAVVKLNPKKIIYISCNPVTQVRDLEYLVSRGYKVLKIQPVDMFAQTVHVETVVKLQR